MNGVRSSRMLERACWRDQKAAWLMRRSQPDLETIADFRNYNGAAIIWTCRSFVRFAPVYRGGAWADRWPASRDRWQPVRGGEQSQAAADAGGGRGGLPPHAPGVPERPREIAAHEAAIDGYLKGLEVADALVDPAEQ